MNKTLREIVDFFNVFKFKGRNADIYFCPSFPYLTTVKTLTRFKLGAQNCFYQDFGAYTGEVSPKMLKDLGVSIVILGHSERRQFFHESNEQILKKVSKVLEHDMLPVVCFGESKVSLASGGYISECEKQLLLVRNLIPHCILAYEPVWAIGSGTTPTTEHLLNIKNWLFNFEVPYRFLYGGSVNSLNCLDFCTLTDGLLIGSASLNPLEFQSICEKVEATMAS